MDRSDYLAPSELGSVGLTIRVQSVPSETAFSTGLGWDAKRKK